jgi:hypothetical protein
MDRKGTRHLRSVSADRLLSDSFTFAIAVTGNLNSTHLLLPLAAMVHLCSLMDLDRSGDNQTSAESSDCFLLSQEGTRTANHQNLGLNATGYQTT